VLFFAQGDTAQTEDFFADVWPTARVVADLPQTFYRAFGVKQAGWRQLFGPEVVACGVRATAGGNMLSKPTGDTKTMPTAVLVHAGHIVWRWDARHVGDHPNWSVLTPAPA
jgi:hypothetical protein